MKVLCKKKKKVIPREELPFRGGFEPQVGPDNHRHGHSALIPTPVYSTLLGASRLHLFQGLRHLLLGFVSDF